MGSINFEKGSKVRITDVKQCYTTYGEKFKELGFRDELDNRPRTNCQLVTHTIFGKTEHRIEGIALYGIRDDYGRELLISEKGLELW